MKYRESKDSSRHIEGLDPENNSTSLKTDTSCNPLDEQDSFRSKVISNHFHHTIIHDEECKMNEIQKPEVYSRSNGNETLDDDHNVIESTSKNNTGNPVQWIFCCNENIINLITINFNVQVIFVEQSYFHIFTDEKRETLYNSWQSELEILRERELSCNEVKVLRDNSEYNNETRESKIRQCFVCPECDRETSNKKQLYRHAAQVFLII